MANPIITLIGDPIVYLTPAQVAGWTDPGATASDAEDGDITGSITTLGAPVAANGTYRISYNVLDANSNRAPTVARTIRVSAALSASAFDIEWKRTGQAATQVIGLTGASHVLTGLLANQAHEWRIRGTAGAGVIGAWTAWDGFTTLVAPPDSVKPVITLIGSAAITITTAQAPGWTDPGATASDNVDGDISGGIVVTGSVGTSEGVYTLYYNVSDSALNAADEVTRVVTVQAPDTVEPVVTLIGPRMDYVELGGAWTDQGATATDARDGAITPVASGTVNTSVLGTYPIIYTATDAAGNIGRQVRFVGVRPSSVPDTYDIEWRVRGGSATQVTGLTTTNYLLNQAASGQPIEWRVRAIKGAVTTSFSAWELFSVNIGLPMPITVSGMDIVTLTATIDDVTVAENAAITFTGTCNQENAVIRVDVGGRTYGTRATGGVWSMTVDVPRAAGDALLLDTLDELAPANALLLEGDAQTGTDNLILE